MNKEKYLEIFEKAIEIKKRDEEVDAALKMLSKLLFESQYPPFVERDGLHYFIEGLELLHEGISEDMHYYFYEAKNMDTCICIDKSGKEYNACILDEYIDFLIAVK